MPWSELGPEAADDPAIVARCYHEITGAHAGDARPPGRGASVSGALAPAAAAAVRGPAERSLTMERLTGIDASFLYMETPTLHMHTIKVAVLEPAPGGRLLARAREGGSPRAPPSPAAVPAAPGRGPVRLPSSGVDRGSRRSISTTTCGDRRGRRRGDRARWTPSSSRIASVAARSPPAALGALVPRRARRRPRRGGREDPSRASPTASRWRRCSRTSWRPGSTDLADAGAGTRVAPEPCRREGARSATRSATTAASSCACPRSSGGRRGT